jgi:hypothetical protein
LINLNLNNLKLHLSCHNSIIDFFILISQLTPTFLAQIGPICDPQIKPLSKNHQIAIRPQHLLKPILARCLIGRTETKQKGLAFNICKYYHRLGCRWGFCSTCGPRSRRRCVPFPTEPGSPSGGAVRTGCGSLTGRNRGLSLYRLATSPGSLVGRSFASGRS